MFTHVKEGFLAELRSIDEAGLRKRERVITSPQGATIRVAQGEVLAQLARVDATLQARLQLPEEAVPQLRIGQAARLQLDAWPYQRHGSVPASLRWISPTPVEQATGRGFIADARIGATPLALRAGMRGVARVEIGRRTLAERALEPLRAAHERMR